MIRLGLAVSLAVLVNLLLFMLMGSMVRNSQLRLDQVETASLVDFVRPQEPDPPPPEHKRPPPQPPKPLPMQPLPRLNASEPPRPAALRIPAPRVALDLELQIDGGPYIGDMLAPAAPSVISARELTALVTLPPRYPPTARARRIEGFVEVEFTVKTDGSTADIQIIRAEPSGVFDRAAEQAIRRWRFQAHRVDGKPMAVRARQRVDFRLGSRKKR